MVQRADLALEAVSPDSACRLGQLLSWLLLSDRLSLPERITLNIFCGLDCWTLTRWTQKASSLSKGTTPNSLGLSENDQPIC